MTGVDVRLQTPNRIYHAPALTVWTITQGLTRSGLNTQWPNLLRSRSYMEADIVILKYYMVFDLSSNIEYNLCWTVLFCKDNYNHYQYNTWLGVVVQLNFSSASACTQVSAQMCASVCTSVQSLQKCSSVPQSHFFVRKCSWECIYRENFLNLLK